MTSVADRVESEDGRVGLGGLDRVGEQLPQQSAAARRERTREVHDLLVVQHGQRRVQVVEPRIDELQAEHAAPEVLARLRV